MMHKKEHWRPIRFVPLLAALALAVACIPTARQSGTKPKDTPPPRETPALPAEGEKKGASKGSPGFFVHKVLWERESLSIIAKWYTGHMRHWKLLVEHNAMDDPNRIRIGDEIAIPEHLLRTRDPLPKSFVDRHAPKLEQPRKAQPPPGFPEAKPPENEAPKDEAPELFGPKEHEEPHSKREKGSIRKKPFLSGCDPFASMPCFGTGPCTPPKRTTSLPT